MNKYIKYIKIILLLLSFNIIIVFFFPGETFRDFGNISWYLLIFIMFIRPLNDIFPKCRILNYLLKFRRELGILVGFSALAHALGFIKLMNYKNYFDVLFDGRIWNYQGMLFWGMIALIISILLLITSNGLSTTILGKNWKRLQRLSYFMFIFVAIHLYLIRGELLQIIIVGIWLVIYIFAYIKNKKIKKIVTNGPKWLCLPCGYIYDENIGDPDSGILPGTKFENIPNDWLCPVCGVGKKDFILIEDKIINNIKNFEGKVKSLIYLTKNVVELKIEVEEDLDYINGQFMNFKYKDNEGTFFRSYSIVTKEENIFTFLIKLGENSRSGVILKSKKEGDKIEYTKISGNFTYKKTNNKKIFIATGTGLAPIYSIISVLNDNIKKELYFGVQKKEDLFYLDKLKKFRNLKIKIYLSQENIEGYNYGRMSFRKIQFDKNDEIYICGNPNVVNSIINYFKENNLENEIFYEKF